MECPRCGQRNLEGARFCNACGERLAAVCHSCAHANPPMGEDLQRAIAIFAETGARRDHSRASSHVEMRQA